MHIEPGLVSEAKIVLSYGTAAASLAYAAKLALDDAKMRGAISLLGRSAIATAAVFTFFQILPHHPVGVSEVHLILGSTLFLMLGVAPAAAGLVPVSYTHLDVYKRQPLACQMRCSPMTARSPNARSAP